MSTNWSYFRMLGHKDGKYYYQQSVTKHIFRLSPNGHTRNVLLALAPLNTGKPTSLQKKVLTGAPQFRR